jgi:dihydroneopterin triphosphate diphosphatase
MTDARVATVDVYPLRRAANAWEVLVLQRAEGTRCTGAWEVVHGRIERGERPEEAALREMREETGLEVERLYNVTVQPFYLHTLDSVTLAVVFAAVIGDQPTVTLGPEHARAEWLPARDAIARLVWPRSRAALGDILSLLEGGDAGPMEDVLRVK